LKDDSMNRLSEVSAAAPSCAVNAAPPGAAGLARTRRLLGLAALIFLLAVGVYVFDRPAGCAYLLPHWLALNKPGQAVFDAMGGSVPSFAHAFVFSIFTALILPASRSRVWLVNQTLRCVGHLRGSTGTASAKHSPAHRRIGMHWSRRLLALALLAMNVALAPMAHAQSHGIAVKAVALDATTIATLENAHQTRLAPGRYWYDGNSGLWGLELGPVQGQVAPGLQLGGTLSPRASVGDRAGITSVFVNGRELHPQELDSLRRLYGHVRSGRYWLDARGIGGYEGGPPQFDLRERAIAERQRPGYSCRASGGSIGSDGDCSYYNDPSSGASVLTGRC
jgi:hypothetical protein